MTIKATKTPNLPLAPTQYLPAYQDQLLNILRLYFTEIDNYTQNLIIPPAGTTADRPVLRVLVGQTYFDTTLGYPVWWNGTDWVDATGAPA